VGIETRSHDVEAETRERLALLAEEQAALRRVATAVAGGVAPEEVFELVTAEAGRLLRASSAGTSSDDSIQSSLIGGAITPGPSMGSAAGLTGTRTVAHPNASKVSNEIQRIDTAAF